MSTADAIEKGIESLIVASRVKEAGYVQGHHAKRINKTMANTIGKIPGLPSYLAKLLFDMFIIPQMRTHQAFPKLSMIGHLKVQKLVHDHIILQVIGKVR